MYYHLGPDPSGVRRVQAIAGIIDGFAATGDPRTIYQKPVTIALSLVITSQTNRDRAGPSRTRCTNGFEASATDAHPVLSGEVSQHESLRSTDLINCRGFSVYMRRRASSVGSPWKDPELTCSTSFPCGSLRSTGNPIGTPQRVTPSDHVRSRRAVHGSGTVGGRHLLNAKKSLDTLNGCRIQLDRP